VPLSALQEERGRRQNLEREISSLRQATDAFAPVGEALRSRPDLLAQLLSNEPAPEKGPKISDTDAREIALELALYDAQGQPNLDAARRYHGRMIATAQKIADTVVEKAVKPVQQQATTIAAKAKRDEAFQAAKALGYGDEIGPVLDDILTKSPDTFTNPETAPTALIAAIGFMDLQQRAAKLQGRQPTPQHTITPTPPTPVFTETPGARPGKTPLTDRETAIARNVGISTETWQRAAASLDQINSGKARGGLKLED
jgi:hypothetical protein